MFMLSFPFPHFPIYEMTCPAPCYGMTTCPLVWNEPICSPPRPGPDPPFLYSALLCKRKKERKREKKMGGEGE